MNVKDILSLVVEHNLPLDIEIYSATMDGFACETTEITVETMMTSGETCLVVQTNNSEQFDFEPHPGFE